MTNAPIATRRGLLLALALLFALPAALLAPAAAAQSGPEKEQKPEWPSLGKKDRKAAEKAYQAIREADGAESPEDQIAEGEATLQGLGASVVPWTLTKLKGKKVAAPESLVRVLDAVVEPKYAPLVADELTARRTGEWTRRWAADWLARRQDEKYRKALTERRDDKDPLVALRCSAGLIGLGDLGGMQQVFLGARNDWKNTRDLFAATLPNARGDKAFETLRPMLKAEKELDRIGALRLARFLAPKSAGPILALGLDSDQFAIKKEAINALRMAVDDKPALSDEVLTVFKINDEATKWKQRFR